MQPYRLIVEDCHGDRSTTEYYVDPENDIQLEANRVAEQMLSDLVRSLIDLEMFLGNDGSSVTTEKAERVLMPMVRISGKAYPK